MTPGPEQPYRGRPGEVIDPAQVDVYRGGHALELRSIDVVIGKDGLVKVSRGLSLDTDPVGTASRFGRACRVRSVPDEPRIIQKGNHQTHFEVVPKRPMTFQRFQELVMQIVLDV